MKNATTLMVQGTTSDAGKSILVAAIGRILARHGYTVAPFKPQNMALNSAVTPEGGEIGRAQAVQAMACNIAPHVDMNPVLLKPNSDTGAQVIVLGKVMGNWEARGYHDKKPSLLNTVLQAHARLVQRVDYVVVEGAGSPAEINLRDKDIANMGFAEAADCPVIIVADIDRGGVFAHLLGTYQCLSASEQKRVVGFVINKFRGDETLLTPANDWLFEKTGIPVVAVIPYIQDLYIEAEDAIDFQQITHDNDLVNIAVVAYPRLSNHTDFDALRLHPNVNLQFVRTPEDLTSAQDLVILPGTKNVIQDLAWLREQNWPHYLDRHLRYGGKLLGVCGGYQMLGQSIADPEGVEGPPGVQSDGLQYLAMTTELKNQKTLTNVTGQLIDCGAEVSGYEIHAGQSKGAALKRPLHLLNNSEQEGAKSEDNQIRGTYLHGLFDQACALNAWLCWAGYEKAKAFDPIEYKNQQIDYLASEVEKAFSLKVIKDLFS